MSHVCRFDAIKPTKKNPYPHQVCKCGDQPHTAYVLAIQHKCPKCGRMSGVSCRAGGHCPERIALVRPFSAEAKGET